MKNRERDNDYEIDAMDQLIEAWERRGSNIVQTMSKEEYLEYCKKYKRMEKRICKQCGSEMIIRKGQFGEFFGCSKFPKCRYTENILR